MNKLFSIVIYLVNVIGGIWIFNSAAQDNKVYLFYAVFVFANVHAFYLNYKIIKLQDKLDEKP